MKYSISIMAIPTVKSAHLSTRTLKIINYVTIICILMLLASCSPGDRLISSAGKGQLKEVKSLIDGGTDINSYGKDGLTPLIAASKGAHIDVVKYLIERGAFINLKYKGGRSALVEAIAFNQPAIVKLLIENKADVNLKTDYDETPLSIAISLNRNDIIPILKKAGAMEKITRPEEKPLSREEAFKRADESRKRFLDSSKK